MTQSVEIYAFKIQQNIGDFYIASMNYLDVLKMAKPDPRRISNATIDKVTGVQREVKETRVKKISEYVQYEFATFPTSVVISINDLCADVESVAGVENLYKITVQNYVGDESDAEDKDIPISDAGYIIDGQHRLFGLNAVKDSVEVFMLNVSIFVGIDVSDRAEVFSTVNLTQSKVNRSLTFDLFSHQTPPSPYRTAHDVTVALDADRNGPFHQKIKRLGVTTTGRSKGSERVSQATVVRGILRYLPANPNYERNKGILGFSKVPEPRENPKVRFLAPFYRLYSRDRSEKDLGLEVDIFNLITNYFQAVEDKWPIAWADEDADYMLCSTNGFNALIRFFRDAYLECNPTPETPKVVSRDHFSKVFNRIDISERTFVVSKYLPGGSGATMLYRDLVGKAFPAKDE